LRVPLKKHIILFVTFFLSASVSGQVQYSKINQIAAGNNEQNSSALAAAQKENLIKMYFQTFATSNNLIDGKEYFNYAYRSKTSPLLYSARTFSAILYKDGRKYDNINLQYDTYIDEVLYLDTSRVIKYQFPRIVLNKNAIDGFILIDGRDSMIFRHLRFLNDREKKTDEGYYEVGYDGPSKFLIRHRSTLYFSEAINEYKYSPENLILKDGIYYKVRNKKELLNLFVSRSKEIHSFLRKNRIKVRKASRQEIAETLKYCDALEKNIK
jgi:hypothetical protein